MCVCVLEILVLKIFKLRDYFERFLCFWITGWVVCWIAFIYVFFTSRKTVLKSWLDTSSIPCGSIEKAPASSIVPRHLLDWSSFYSESNSLLLDTSAIEDQILDTYLDRSLDTSWYLHLSRFTSCLYNASMRSGIHFSSISLSWYFSIPLPKHSHLTPNLLLKDASSFFKFLLTW